MIVDLPNYILEVNSTRIRAHCRTTGQKSNVQTINGLAGELGFTPSRIPVRQVVAALSDPKAQARVEHLFLDDRLAGEWS